MYIAVVGDTMNTDHVVGVISPEDKPRKEYINTKNEVWLSCGTESGAFYEIPAAGQDWIEENIMNGSIKSGQTELDLPSGTLLDTFTHKLIVNGEIKLKNADEGDTKQTFSTTSLMLNRRKLFAEVAEKANGVRSVLVVRVVLADGEPTNDEQTLGESVFGIDGGSDVNMAGQFNACSHGKLTISKATPVDGSSASIVNGVTTVSVNMLVADHHGKIRNAVTAELNSQFGVVSPTKLVDHVMYCLPPGSMPAVAYGLVGSWVTVYLNHWCTFMS